MSVLFSFLLLFPGCTRGDSVEMKTLLVSLGIMIVIVSRKKTLSL